MILRWWNWCQQEAELVYRAFLKAPLAVRESLVPTSTMPAPWQQLEAWIRPRLLDSLPKDIQQWVQSRERQGVIDSSHVLLFYALKSFAPGGAEEKVHWVASIMNPSVCSQPRAAQTELLRWKPTFAGAGN